jgi:signal transduction histidine kinase
MEGSAARRERERRTPFPGGLSGRLLALTVGFILLSQSLIIAPLLAQQQDRWLNDRIRAAELASVAVELAPEQTVPDMIAAQLVEGAGVLSVAIQVNGLRRLYLAGPAVSTTPRLIDLRDRTLVEWLAAPIITLSRGDALVRVIQNPQFRDADFVEILAPAAPLRAELRAVFWRALWISFFVSAVTGGLVWLTLTNLLVRPIRRLTLSITRFRQNPNDPAARVELSGRTDEIGRAEAELSRMQADLRAALHSRARMAALGEAVAKINHDLRNMLTSAQLASERLSGSEDPRVSMALPRLERALDRAIGLAEGVLAYGRSTEPEPMLAGLGLRNAVAVAAEDAGLSDDGVRLQNRVGDTVRVFADPDQLHRILVNLLRNAREAIESAPARDGLGRVTVEHAQPDNADVIRLTDDGPGVPEKAQARLFQAFGSGRSGGTGLGLAIARELAQAHGGDVALVRTGPEGSTFEVRLPAR